MKKRIISLLLAALMLATLLPVQVWAEEVAEGDAAFAENAALDETENASPEAQDPQDDQQEDVPPTERVTDDTTESDDTAVSTEGATIVTSGEESGITWTLDSDGLLTISGEGNMPNWEWSNGPLYKIREAIKQVRIEKGVTSIGRFAFNACINMTHITIPDSVRSIGWYAFFGCRSLTEITFPESIEGIGMSAFEGCTSLTSITFSSGTTSISSGSPGIGAGAFAGCTSLTSIIFSNGVTRIAEGMFSGFDSLTNITIPQSVTSIGDGAFRECNNLTDVYYAGTIARWRKIDIGSDNEPLAAATIHCTRLGSPISEGINLIW